MGGKISLSPCSPSSTQYLIQNEIQRLHSLKQFDHQINWLVAASFLARVGLLKDRSSYDVKVKTH